MLTPLLLAAALLPAILPSQRPFPFAEIKTFRCEFADGEGRAVREGKITTRRGDGFSDPLIIDNIDYTKRTARLIGNVGGSDLSLIVNGQLAVTFAEYTAVGGVSILTIFKHGAGFDLHHRAVFSRHLPFTEPPGALSTTQYYGTCRGQL